jgi:23S rRNA (cytosine1962-C5)-methyltransferase
MDKNGYALIDSGEGKKLERFGPYVLSRPAPAAVWKKQHPEEWQQVDALFSREEENRWTFLRKLPEQWVASFEGVQMKIAPTDFGHLGIFPEQQPQWKWMREKIEKRKKTQETVRVLNLFAYSGGATLACSQGGAHLCHLDASKGMVQWARENADLNNLTQAPIRWIVEDVMKFVQREIKRGNSYDAIIFDPPSFGRGAKGEVFKIENEIEPLLTHVRTLLSPTPLFVLFSCHTPGFSPQVLHNLLSEHFGLLPGSIETGEMSIQSTTMPLPSGAFARWAFEA